MSDCCRRLLLSSLSFSYLHHFIQNCDNVRANMILLHFFYMGTHYLQKDASPFLLYVFFLFFLKENKIIRVRDTISYFVQSVTDGPINGSVEGLTDRLRQWLIESRARD